MCVCACVCVLREWVLYPERYVYVLEPYLDMMLDKPTFDSHGKEERDRERQRQRYTQRGERGRGTHQYAVVSALGLLQDGTP